MITAITLFTIFTNIILGLLVYLRNKKSLTHIFTALFALCLALWTLGNFFALTIESPETRFFWVKVVMLVTAPMPEIFFLLSQVFPHAQVKIRRRVWIVCAISTLVVAAFAFTPWMFSEYKTVNGANQLTPGPAIILYGMNIVLFCAAAVITLVKKYRRSHGAQKVQLFYFLTGLVLTIFFGFITNYVIVVLLRDLSAVVLGPAFSLLMISLISYAIIKHRLWDIKFILVRSLAYVLLIASITAIYSVTLFTLVTFIAGQKVSPVTTIIFIIISLIIAYTFEPLTKIFERLTEKFLYKHSYNSRDLLQKTSRLIAATILLSELSESVLGVLQKNMNILHVSLIVLDKDAVMFSKMLGQTSHENSDSEVVSLIHEAVHKKSEQILIFDELGESVVKNKMRKSDLSVVLPLLVKDEVVGGLLIGPESSGEIYSNQDIEVFKILVPQLAVAVRNALSYEEIRRFNVTLEQEVERATHKLKAANERLKELDGLKDEFVSIASHELRTPMTAIKSYLWLALNNTDEPLSKDLRSYLNIAYHSTERLIRLVQDMLTISRIEGKRLELHKSVVDFSELVKQVFDELKIQGDEKKIAFTLKKPEKDLFVEGDKEKLREVIQNLIGNALKFTPEKGKVQVSFEQDKTTMSLSVADTGSGIDAEDMPKLFQKFSRLDSSYKMVKDSGTGLGLYISQQIVSLHGGQIAVESEVGVGSTFRVILPKYAGKK